MKTLVLGIGNNLLSDDGVGIHAVERMRATAPAGVECLDGGTLSFSLLETVEEADRLIVLDAAQLDAPPGTVRVHENEAMDRYLRSGRRSVHEVGLADVLDMARLTGHLPQPRALIGIQPQELGWGERPTPVVEAAMADAIALAEELIVRWDERANVAGEESA